MPIGRVMARQLAYAGSEEAKDEEIDIGEQKLLRNSMVADQKQFLGALAGEDFNGDTDGPTRRGKASLPRQ